MHRARNETHAHVQAASSREDRNRLTPGHALFGQAAGRPPALPMRERIGSAKTVEIDRPPRRLEELASWLAEKKQLSSNKAFARALSIIEGKPLGPRC